MRSLSGLYFLLRIVVFGSSWTLKITNNSYFMRCIIFVITALVIASLKPYQKAYMNHMDTLLLLNLALLCYVMSSASYLPKSTMLLFAKTLVSIPLAAFILISLLKFIYQKLHLKVTTCISQKLYVIRALLNTDCEPAQSSTADAPATAQEQQPLIQPTCTEINYGV